MMILFYMCFYVILRFLILIIYNMHKYIILKLYNFKYKFYSLIYSKEFWFTVIITALVSLSLRTSIVFFFNFNVFIEPCNRISVLYFFTMSILIPLIKLAVNNFITNDISNLSIMIKVVLISKSFWFGVVNMFIIGFAIRVNISYLDILPIIYYNYNVYIGINIPHYDMVLNMMPNNNLKAGRLNGAVHVTDPLNQGYVYQNNNNQPLLGNIGRGLEAQRLLGLSSLSKHTFTPQQEQYVLTFLLNNHRDVYDNIMQGQVGNPNEPC